MNRRIFSLVSLGSLMGLMLMPFQSKKKIEEHESIEPGTGKDYNSFYCPNRPDWDKITEYQGREEYESIAWVTNLPNSDPRSLFNNSI